MMNKKYMSTLSALLTTGCMILLLVFSVNRSSALDKRGFWRDACIEVDWYLQDVRFSEEEKGISLEGYVRNIYQTPLENVRVVVRHYDDADKLSSKKYVNVNPSTISAGGQGDFSNILRDENYEEGRITVEAEYSIKTDVPVRGR